MWKTLCLRQGTKSSLKDLCLQYPQTTYACRITLLVLFPVRVFTQHSQPYMSSPELSSGDADTSYMHSPLAPTTSYVIENWSIIMLVFVPIGITAPYIGFNDFAVFVLNCLAIIPLADLLCRATDKVAGFLGETVGALVNVTMGNVAELAIFMHVAWYLLRGAAVNKQQSSSLTATVHDCKNLDSGVHHCQHPSCSRTCHPHRGGAGACPDVQPSCYQGCLRAALFGYSHIAGSSHLASSSMFEIFLRC